VALRLQLQLQQLHLRPRQHRHQPLRRQLNLLQLLRLERHRGRAQHRIRDRDRNSLVIGDQRPGENSRDSRKFPTLLCLPPRNKSERHICARITRISANDFPLIEFSRPFALFAGLHSSSFSSFVSSVNGAEGISDIEGEAATGSGERAGKQASFKSAVPSKCLDSFALSMRKTKVPLGAALLDQT
jgi:hypothetical protein